MLYRILKKLTPPGLHWGSVVFFALDMKRKRKLLTSFRPSGHEPPPVEYYIIDSSADRWLDVLCDAYPEKQFRQRMLEEGQRCYIAILDGKLAAYAWVTTASCCVSEIEFQLPVGPGRLYIYDCFVRADYRGQGLYTAVLMKIVADYRLHRWPSRYELACICAEPGNTASIRGIKRAGFEQLGQVTYFRIGRFSRSYGAQILVEQMSAASPSGPSRLLSD